MARPFGAVIVREATGEVVAEGRNRSSGDAPMWHEEVDAVQRCAIEYAGFGRVLDGTSIRTLQRPGWRQIDIPAEEVTRRTLPSQRATGPVPWLFSSRTCWRFANWWAASGPNTSAR
jgi:hypothetical protein